jgi:HD-GYP domain-containing protein (c-di-GMP phosphodiesterase class II)
MHYAVGIAEMMKISPKDTEVIRRAAMIHDIGNIGIPDVILSKPAELSPHERKIIEQHPLIAVRILDKMSFLKHEVAIIRAHHEKWNGQGYPDGISKTKIPIGARILAVADTFDALISDRSYHHPRPVEEAIGILTDSSGYDFDPDAVNAMVMWVRKIQKQHKNTDQLTSEDLLASQKCPIHNPVADLIVDTCAVDV